MITFQTIERCHLSDGSLLELTRAGRKYRVMKASPVWLEPPTIHADKTVKEARQIYADYLEADVCEIDI